MFGHFPAGAWQHSTWATCSCGPKKDQDQCPIEISHHRKGYPSLWYTKTKHKQRWTSVSMYTSPSAGCWQSGLLAPPICTLDVTHVSGRVRYSWENHQGNCLKVVPSRVEVGNKPVLAVLRSLQIPLHISLSRKCEAVPPHNHQSCYNHQDLCIWGWKAPQPFSGRWISSPWWRTICGSWCH